MKDTENIQDEINEQKKKWKDMTPAQRGQYYKDYYLIPTIIGSIILIALLFMVRDIRKNSREEVLSVFVINVNEFYVGTDDVVDAYFEYAGFDPKKERILFERNNKFINDSTDYGTIATVSRFDRGAIRGDIDLLIIPEKDFDYFKEYFVVDLKEYLDPEWYEEIKDFTFTSDILEDKEIEVGFYGDQIKEIKNGKMFGEGEKVLFIPLSNSSRLETAKDFYLFWREL